MRHDDSWRIDPSSHCDVCSLHLLFLKLQLLSRQPCYFHHSSYIHTFCQHLFGNFEASLIHALFHSFSQSFFFSFSLSGINRILDITIRHLAGFVLSLLLRSKTCNLGFFEEAVEDLVASGLRTLGELVEILQGIEPLVVERFQFVKRLVELGDFHVDKLQLIVENLVRSCIA